MKKKILILFLILLIAGGAILLYIDYCKYNGKEKIIATIQNVDKQKYQYEYYDQDAVGGNKHKTKTAYYKHIYYSFEYNNIQLNDVDEVYSIFMKKGKEITIYYDKYNNSSEIYMIPFNKFVVLITGVLYFVISILIFIKKQNINFLFTYPNAPWFVQIIIMLFGYFCYRPHDSVSYYISYFFMLISLLITVNCLRQTIKKSKI